MEIDDATAPTSTTTNSGDVDSDCNNLLQEFSRLGTTDRDVLISKMQQLTNGLSTMESTFFLDMNNWNLEAAVWTYYDLASQVAGNQAQQQQQQEQQQQQQQQQSEPQQLPEMQGQLNQLQNSQALQNTFVGCISQPDGTNQSWEVNLPARFMTLVEDRTVGNGEAVTPDTPFIKTWRLRNTGLHAWPEGVVLKYVEGYNIQGEDVRINQMVSPNEEIDVSVRLRSPSDPGCYFSNWRLHDAQGPFGDSILILVQVQEGGVMAVTQQMDACHACE
ncbi:uncharacterized protein C6orf106 homolog [Galendromus occidentalis]|uniref:Uncharacterized protein C6orf106 homolog n=1 Tax=Galendromus occidentalis TaxID=34638 RepID=A0AAJ7L488_9ACAR|nr:uncharacterized protein C6orf106 homolog [Galendromus occidentalis]